MATEVSPNVLAFNFKRVLSLLSFKITRKKSPKQSGLFFITFVKVFTNGGIRQYA